MKRILLIILILATKSEVIANNLVPTLPAKNGSFPTSHKLLPYEIELMREVKLNEYQNCLLLRHVEIIMDGPESSCGNIEVQTDVRKGNFKQDGFRDACKQMLLNAGGFKHVINETELGNKNSRKELYEKYGKFLMADVGIYWEGCQQYRFELKIILPDSIEDAPLLMLTRSNSHGLKNLNKSLFYPVFNGYKKWIEQSTSNKWTKDPKSLISLIDEVKIGDQTWSRKNLNVDHFQNGDKIRQAKNEEEWQLATAKGEPVWCYYMFNEMNEHRFGKLYNLYVLLDKRGIAPKGWHVPSQSEWNKILNNHFVKETIFSYTVITEEKKEELREYARKLRVKDVKKNYISERDWINYWLKPGTNETGFSAIPSGYYSQILGFRETESLFPKAAQWWFKNKNPDVVGSFLMDLEVGIKIDFVFGGFSGSHSMQGNSIRLVKD